MPGAPGAEQPCASNLLECCCLQVLRTYLHQFFHPEVVGLAGGRVRALPGSKVVVPSSAHRQDYVQVGRAGDWVRKGAGMGQWG